MEINKILHWWMDEKKCRHDVTVIVANSNEKKWRQLELMLQPTHWLHVFLVAVGHHFWPRLMAGAEIEQGRKTENNGPGTPPPAPPPPQKEKTKSPPWVHAEPSHWLHEISIFKTVRHHFWAGLMAGSVNWGHSKNKTWGNHIPLGSYSNICLFFCWRPTCIWFVSYLVPSTQGPTCLAELLVHYCRGTYCNKNSP
jgi:hypothetical protein